MIEGLVAAVVAVLLAVLYGKRERKAGRSDVVDEIERADRAEAQGVKEKLDAVATDGNALDRLRKHGKLRD